VGGAVGFRDEKGAERTRCGSLLENALAEKVISHLVHTPTESGPTATRGTFAEGDRKAPLETSNHQGRRPHQRQKLGLVEDQPKSLGRRSTDASSAVDVELRGHIVVFVFSSVGRAGDVAFAVDFIPSCVPKPHPEKGRQAECLVIWNCD